MFFDYLKISDCFANPYSYLYCFYFRDSAYSNKSVQLTTEGVEDVVYCGIPDWVYEGIIQSFEFFKIKNAIFLTIQSNK